MMGNIIIGGSEPSCYRRLAVRVVCNGDAIGREGDRVSVLDKLMIDADDDNDDDDELVACC